MRIAIPQTVPVHIDEPGRAQQIRARQPPDQKVRPLWWLKALAYDVGVSNQGSGKLRGRVPPADDVVGFEGLQARLDAAQDRTALGDAGLLADLVERRHQNGQEQCDDPDDDHQLDQSEC